MKDRKYDVYFLAYDDLIFNLKGNLISGNLLNILKDI